MTYIFSRPPALSWILKPLIRAHAQACLLFLESRKDPLHFFTDFAGARLCEVIYRNGNEDLRHYGNTLNIMISTGKKSRKTPENYGKFNFFEKNDPGPKLGGGFEA